MSVRRGTGHAYFVGRRRSGTAEVYEVSASAVDRFQSARIRPDWSGSAAQRIELSRALLSRLLGERPSRDLETRFALYVLERLPDGGFVLDSDAVRRWLRVAGDAHDEPARPSWSQRLRLLLHPIHRADV